MYNHIVVNRHESKWSAATVLRVRSVCRSVCPSVGNDRQFLKTDDSIEMPFGVVGGTTNRVFGVGVHIGTTWKIR